MSLEQKAVFANGGMGLAGEAEFLLYAGLLVLSIAVAIPNVILWLAVLLKAGSAPSTNSRVVGYACLITGGLTAVVTAVPLISAVRVGTLFGWLWAPIALGALLFALGGGALLLRYSRWQSANGQALAERY